MGSTKDTCGAGTGSGWGGNKRRNREIYEPATIGGFIRIRSPKEARYAAPVLRRGATAALAPGERTADPGEEDSQGRADLVPARNGEADARPAAERSRALVQGDTAGVQAEAHVVESATARKGLVGGGTDRPGLVRSIRLPGAEEPAYETRDPMPGSLHMRLEGRPSCAASGETPGRDEDPQRPVEVGARYHLAAEPAGWPDWNSRASALSRCAHGRCSALRRIPT